MCGAPYTTAFLADCLRGRKLLPVEEAMRLMTSAPADSVRAAGPGRILRPGAHADLVALRPRHGRRRGPSTRRPTCPGNSARLVADSEGIPHVFVNGRETVRDGAPTGELSGSLLRSGRDTDTVEP